MRNASSEQKPKSSSFQIRFFFAVLLLAAMIIMEKNQIKVAGITAENISEAISANYEDFLENWVEKNLQ